VKCSLRKASGIRRKLQDDRSGFISGRVANNHSTFAQERLIVNDETIFTDRFVITAIANTNRLLKAKLRKRDGFVRAVAAINLSIATTMMLEGGKGGKKFKILI
jgi:hypothetical protein